VASRVARNTKNTIRPIVTPAAAASRPGPNRLTVSKKAFNYPPRSKRVDNWELAFGALVKNGVVTNAYPSSIWSCATNYCKSRRQCNRNENKKEEEIGKICRVLKIESKFIDATIA
jgi:hypothetical protein